MIGWLLDTSILIGMIHIGDPRQKAALAALARLLRRSALLYVVPQNLIEFWAVVTRPIAANGLGLSIEDAENEIAQIKSQFELKSEDKTIFENWENLVKTYRVSGKTTHDARIVAAMQTHGITHLLTFNVADFQRDSTVISVESPQDVISQS